LLELFQIQPDLRPAFAAPTAQSNRSALWRQPDGHAHFALVIRSFSSIRPAFETRAVSHQYLELFRRLGNLVTAALHHPAMRRRTGNRDRSDALQMIAAAPITLFADDLDHHLFQFGGFALPLFQTQPLPQRHETFTAIDTPQPSPAHFQFAK